MSAGAHAEPGEEDGLEGGLEADLDTGTEFDIEVGHAFSRWSFWMWYPGPFLGSLPILVASFLPPVGVCLLQYEDDESAHIADMLDTIKQRRQAAQDDIQYPDEVEVPPDVAARQRFGKYRGLKSFRTSPWDPKESLPPEYARVFAFERPRRWVVGQHSGWVASTVQPAIVGHGGGVRHVSHGLTHACAKPQG